MITSDTGSQLMGYFTFQVGERAIRTLQAMPRETAEWFFRKKLNGQYAAAQFSSTVSRQSDQNNQYLRCALEVDYGLRRQERVDIGSPRSKGSATRWKFLLSKMVTSSGSRVDAFPSVRPIATGNASSKFQSLNREPAQNQASHGSRLSSQLTAFRISF
jgi:hypothetical protein